MPFVLLGRDSTQVAWRNERIHFVRQMCFSTAMKDLVPLCEDLVSDTGARIRGKTLTVRFANDVRAADAYEAHPEHSDERRIYADRLDATTPDLDAECARPVWLTVQVPVDAEPGSYRGAFSVRSSSGETCRWPVALKVIGRTLPSSSDRRFFLDVWQHPLGVARYHRVTPYSPEHYALLKPLWEELASAGQKVITAPVVDYPWCEGASGSYGGDSADNPIRTLIRYIRHADGALSFDFSRFDEYVSFCLRCGLGPQIHCYTLVKFSGKTVYQYVDAVSGQTKDLSLETGSDEWRAYLSPLLRALRAHLKERGWFENAYMAIDEAVPESTRQAYEFLRREFPDFKFAMACNKAPESFRGIEADVWSQIAWHDRNTGRPFLDDGFLSTVSARRSRGLTTTFYVCVEPRRPNTWMTSDPAEARWIGQYAAAKGFDGFLRWAYAYWPTDPLVDGTVTGSPPGEDYLVYPHCRLSVRWENLRKGLDDWEKIRILRQDGAMTPELEKALSGMDFPAAEAADPELFRRQVAAVVRALEAVE